MVVKNFSAYDIYIIRNTQTPLLSKQANPNHTLSLPTPKICTPSKFYKLKHARDVVDIFMLIRKVGTICLDGYANGTTNDNLYATMQQIANETKSATQYQVARRRRVFQ